MKSGVASMLAKRLPPPGALAADGPVPMDDPKAEPGDEGDDAAGESAMADFFAAYKKGDAAAGWSAFKEMMGMCGPSDEGDEPPTPGKGY